MSRAIVRRVKIKRMINIYIYNINHPLNFYATNNLSCQDSVLEGTPPRGVPYPTLQRVKLNHWTFWRGKKAGHAACMEQIRDNHVGTSLRKPMASTWHNNVFFLTWQTWYDVDSHYLFSESINNWCKFWWLVCSASNFK